MFLRRKLIPTRRCCLQIKAAYEGKMGSAQLNGRRNGSEMRLFPRKAVILIPSCAVLKSVFLVTFVTTDKSNPQRSGRTKTVCTIYPQRNRVKAKNQPPHFCGGHNSKLSGYITLRFQILATPLSTAAFATAFATASLTLGSNAAGMM